MQEKLNELLLAFFKSHPAIAPTTVEKELDLPSTTIRQALAGAQLIPVKHLYPIICYLAGYGLQIDGYSLSYDAADNTLSGRKWVENMETVEEDGGFAYIVKEHRFNANDVFDILL